MKWYGIDLRDPKPEHIDLDEMAAALAGLRRYQGRGLSVAAHSLRVMEAVPPRAKLWALLHDAHESITGDPSGPLCKLLGLALIEITDRLDACILSALGVPEPSREVRALVDAADLADRELELRLIMTNRVGMFASDDKWYWLQAVRSLLPPR